MERKLIKPEHRCPFTLSVARCLPRSAFCPKTQLRKQKSAVKNSRLCGSRNTYSEQGAQKHEKNPARTRCDGFSSVFQVTNNEQHPTNKKETPPPSPTEPDLDWPPVKSKGSASFPRSGQPIRTNSRPKRESSGK